MATIEPPLAASPETDAVAPATVAPATVAPATVAPATVARATVARATVLTPALAQSESLHARVRRFADLALSPPLFPPNDADTFEELALDIATFQAATCPGFMRLLGRMRANPETVDEIPAVAVDTFRLTRVAAHPPELDSHVFLTSGTTHAESGRHPVRTIETYAHLALHLARRTLFAQDEKGVVIALAEDPGEKSSSSLGLMMQLLMTHMDGEALAKDPRGAAFRLDDPGRWLMRRGVIDLGGLRRSCDIARARSRPLFILATAFALAATLEALDGQKMRVPRRTTVMVTGGFKGRHTALSAGELRREAAEAFGTSEERILGEYGMTELTSQLYEGWPGAASEESTPGAATPAGWRPGPGQAELYFAPPWLRVTAVDPKTGHRVPTGTPGLARFCDLGNIDSALVIVTEDLIVEQGGGIHLLGRRSGAPPRGCSLPFEGMISAGLRTEGRRSSR